MSDQSLVTNSGEDKELSSREVVRAWLLRYAWAHPDQASKEAEVDCIMAQDGWTFLDVQVENYMGMRSGERDVQDDLDSATELALSALYECHTTPHQPTCPYWKEHSHE